jgi:hypothetical protein
VKEDRERAFISGQLRRDEKLSNSVTRGTTLRDYKGGTLRAMAWRAD